MPPVVCRFTPTHYLSDLRGSDGLQTPCCDTEHAHSHLQTQARSIIQMSDEQNSQYVGMLYCVDLNMCPLCSSTCCKQSSKDSLISKEGVEDWLRVMMKTYNVGVLFPTFFAFRFGNLL